VGRDEFGWLPAAKGSYALLLRLAETAVIQVGRLGRFDLAAGYYLYLGSALGPGGLRARLRRHLTADKSPFWHIDYLRQQAAVDALWYAADGRNWEHHWAAAALALPGATVAVSRFGASDCRCPTHLLFWRERPLLTAVWGATAVTSIAAPF
jgi:Uri superfamily endonuclease